MLIQRVSCEERKKRKLKHFVPKKVNLGIFQDQLLKLILQQLKRRSTTIEYKLPNQPGIGRDPFEWRKVYLF